MLRALIHLIALVAIAWLLPWNIQFFRALYLVDPNHTVEIYGKVASLQSASWGNRLSIWIDGDARTRWDLFLDESNAQHLVTNYRQGDVVRLAGYSAGEGHHLAVQMEAKEYALDSVALAKRANQLRLIGGAMNGLILFVLFEGIARRMSKRRSIRFA